MYIFSKFVLCTYTYIDVIAFLTQMCYFTRKHRTTDPHILRESSIRSLHHVTIMATRTFRLLPTFFGNLCTTLYTQCLKPSPNRGNTMHNHKSFTTENLIILKWSLGIYVPLKSHILCEYVVCYCSSNLISTKKVTPS